MHLERQEIDLEFVFLTLVDHSTALFDCLASRLEVAEFKPGVGRYEPRFLDYGLTQLKLFRDQVDKPLNTVKQALDERVTPSGFCDDLVQPLDCTCCHGAYEITKLLLHLNL